MPAVKAANSTTITGASTASPSWPMVSNRTSRSCPPSSRMLWGRSTKRYRLFTIPLVNDSPKTPMKSAAARIMNQWVTSWDFATWPFSRA